MIASARSPSRLLVLLACCAACSGKGDDPPPDPDAGDLAAQLAAVSQRGIYFGHQSVGGNIVNGVRTLLASSAGAEPSMVTTENPASMGAGIWADSAIGTNYDPLSKIGEFQANLNGGIGAKVDVAFMKFCWVDFDDCSSCPQFWATGTAESLFAAYRTALTALKAAHPGVTFVHFTSAIRTASASDHNDRREAYNALVRSTYGGVEPVFDLALVESTRPDGTREIGPNGPALVPAYASDVGHLNATGQDVVARALVAFLAALPQ